MIAWIKNSSPHVSQRRAEVSSDVGTLGTEVHCSLCFTHTRVIYKVHTQEENVANDSNPLSWGSFYVSPHRRTEEGIQGLWDLAITSASIWLKHFQKYGLLESVDVNGTYTKSDKRWGMISGGDRVVGIHTLLYAHVCVRQRERWTSVPSVPTPPLQNHTSTPQKWISTLPR